MSWLDTLVKLNKARKVKAQLDKMQKLKDLSDKVANADQKKALQEAMAFFRDKTMAEILKKGREHSKATAAAEKAKLVYPKCDSLKVFMAAMSAASKYGADSPQTKKALDKYLYVLKLYELELITLVADLKHEGKRLVERQKLVKAKIEYAKLLAKNFEKAAMIPSFYGTAQNAYFLGLHFDMQKYGGTLSSWRDSLQRLEKKNDGYIKELNDLISINKLWIAWAASDRYSKDDKTMKKNAKSKKPK